MRRNKKLLLQMILILSLVFVGFALITHLQFDVSVLDYLRFSTPLTKEEREYLKEKETLVYGMDWKAPPLTFTNEETNQNEGLLIDYMSALSIELGVNVAYEAIPFNEIMDCLDRGDIEMSDLFESPDRLKKYAFTQPLYRLRGIAVTNAKRQDMQSISELIGKRIGIVEDDFAVEHCNLYYPEGEKGTEYIMVKDMKEGLKLLKKGEVDVLAGDETVIDYYVEELNLKSAIREVGDGLYEKNVTFAVRKQDTVLLKALNKGILNLKKNNILVQAQNKWFDTSAPVITDINALRWLPFTVAAVFIVFICFLYWQSIMDQKIHERTREIQVQKDNQRTIIDNIQSMLLVVNRDGLVVDVNQAALRILGTESLTSTGSLIGRNVNSIPLLSALLNAHETSSPDKIHSLHGSYYTVFTRQLNSFDNSKLIVIDDQTEKTMAEKRLRQESKMSAVGQLSAGLAHEIRNPLGLIKNYTYLLKYGIDSMEKNEEIFHAIHVIGDSTDRINGLVENLLKFSRLGDEKMTQVNLYELIHNIEALGKKRLEKTGIRFSIVCEQDVRFYTSEETLKITLLNLINNAADALMDYDSGPERKRIDCHIEVDEQRLTIRIADNGPGIAEEHLDALFMPFFTTKDGGTGLGLYTVSSELEKLGGSIQLDHEYKEGAAFIVKIPSKQEVSHDYENEYRQ